MYRGVANLDTVAATSKITRANKLDTSAYLLLDTVTNLLWHYKIGSNAWTQAGGGVSVSSFSGGTTGLTPSTATTGAVTLGGTLAVANGGTGQSTLATQRIMVGNGTGGVLTPDLLRFANNSLSIGTTSSGATLNVAAAGEGSFNLIDLDQTNTYLGMGHNGGESNWVSRNGDLNGRLAFYSQSSAGFSIRMFINADGNVGIGTASPTAVLHLKAGTATAYTAPLKFTSGTNLTTAEAGAMEFNGTNLLFTPSTTRHTVNHGLTGSATLDFPSTTTLLSADLTITVTGAADGDVVSLGVPNAAVNANTSYSAWVSAANTVTVRFNNYSSGTVDPASGTFKVFVTK